MDLHNTELAEGSPRVIKRYSNRKLYDTGQSRYVTLLEVAEMIRAGDDVQVLDNDTKADKTDVTLALIISEELKTKPRAIPLATLRALIRHRGGRLLTGLRDGPMGRFISADGHIASETSEAPEKPTNQQTQAPDGGAGEDSMASSEEGSEREPPRGLLGAIEHWQHLIDERIRTVLRNYSTIGELQQRVRDLTERVARLEAQGSTKPSQDQRVPGTAEEPARE